jgi:hypothetical protein
MNPIDCDVLASGGGMAGTVAAIAAAATAPHRAVRALRLLGGAATGAVGQFVGWRRRPAAVIRPAPEEIVQRLEAMDGSGGPATSSVDGPSRMDRVEYDTGSRGGAGRDGARRGRPRALHGQLAQVSRRGGRRVGRGADQAA